MSTTPTFLEGEEKEEDRRGRETEGGRRSNSNSAGGARVCLVVQNFVATLKARPGKERGPEGDIVRGAAGGKRDILVTGMG